MSANEQASGAGKGKDEYVVTLNTEDVEFDHQTLTFEELVQRAYPVPPSPYSRFTVTYYDAHKPKEGTLKAGGSIEVKKKDTVVNVKPTVTS